MTLTVESENKRIHAHHDTSISKEDVFIHVTSCGTWNKGISIKHSDIDPLIETLQKYKSSMIEVLGADALR